MEKEYLDSKNVTYQEILVDKNPEEAKIMVELSGQMGVPLTVVTSDSGQKEFILGFDRARIDKAAGISSST